MRRIKRHYKKIIKSFLLVLFISAYASATQAQPVATLEFEKSIGQFGFYENPFPEQPNSIPPTGFNNPTGIDWLSSNKFVVADKNNNKL